MEKKIFKLPPTVAELLKPDDEQIEKYNIKTFSFSKRTDAIPLIGIVLDKIFVSEDRRKAAAEKNVTLQNPLLVHILAIPSSIETGQRVCYRHEKSKIYMSPDSKPYNIRGRITVPDDRKSVTFEVIENTDPALKDAWEDHAGIVSHDSITVKPGQIHVIDTKENCDAVKVGDVVCLVNTEPSIFVTKSYEMVVKLKISVAVKCEDPFYSKGSRLDCLFRYCHPYEKFWSYPSARKWEHQINLIHVTQNSDSDEVARVFSECSEQKKQFGFSKNWTFGKGEFKPATDAGKQSKYVISATGEYHQWPDAEIADSVQKVIMAIHFWTEQLPYIWGTAMHEITLNLSEALWPQLYIAAEVDTEKTRSTTSNLTHDPASLEEWKAILKPHAVFSTLRETIVEHGLSLPISYIKEHFAKTAVEESYFWCHSHKEEATKLPVFKNYGKPPSEFMGLNADVVSLYDQSPSDRVKIFELENQYDFFYIQDELFEDTTLNSENERIEYVKNLLDPEPKQTPAPTKKRGGAIQTLDVANEKKPIHLFYAVKKWTDKQKEEQKLLRSRQGLAQLLGCSIDKIPIIPKEEDISNTTMTIEKSTTNGIVEEEEVGNEGISLDQEGNIKNEEGVSMDQEEDGEIIDSEPPSEVITNTKKRSQPSQKKNPKGTKLVKRQAEK